MTISLGHDCAGIDAVSVALDMLNIDVEYEFASEVNKSCVKQIMSHYPRGDGKALDVIAEVG